MDKMFSEEGFEKTYQWAVNTIKEYPNCNLLIWQMAVMLDSRRIIGMCENPDRYDEQINSWYEMALNDKDEKIQHHAADSLFGFYLRKKNYEMAEKYLNYFSDYDPMKKVKQGQLYMKQGKKEEAFEMLEKAVFSEYTTLNLAFGIMITKALEEKDNGYARFLAEKMCTLVKRGICKVNFATELRAAYSKAVRETLEDEKVFDPKAYGKAGIAAVKELVMARMKVCGCDGKAE